MNAVAHYDVPKICLLSHSSPNNLTKNWKNTMTLSPDVPCHPCHQMHFSRASCPLSYVEVSKPEIRAKWPICMASGIKRETVVQAMTKYYLEGNTHGPEGRQVESVV